MAVPAVNITIEKGTYFENTFNIDNDDGSPYNLSNYTGIARIRKHPSASTYHSFSVTITALSGLIKLIMVPSVTSQLKEGRNYYDVVITDNANPDYKIKVIEGTAIVIPSISV